MKTLEEATRALPDALLAAAHLIIDLEDDAAEDLRGLAGARALLDELRELRAEPCDFTLRACRDRLALLEGLLSDGRKGEDIESARVWVTILTGLLSTTETKAQATGLNRLSDETAAATARALLGKTGGA